jgi:hypothetical protein
VLLARLLAQLHRRLSELLQDATALAAVDRRREPALVLPKAGLRAPSEPPRQPALSRRSRSRWRRSIRRLIGPRSAHRLKSTASFRGRRGALGPVRLETSDDANALFSSQTQRLGARHRRVRHRGAPRPFEYWSEIKQRRRFRVSTAVGACSRACGRSVVAAAGGCVERCEQ